MQPFEYVRPATIAEATAFLAENADASLVLGGGSAAVVMLELGVVRPEYVVDIGAIEELTGLERNGLEQNGELRIGALTRIRALELNEGVRREYGLLAEAASQVANVRVRNVATVGGAVAYGEPQTDTPAALIAYGATVRIAGPSGSRASALEDFYLGPYETALEPGELVVGLDVPHPGPGAGGCHMKFAIGSPENKPVANASVLATVDPSSGVCSSARIVMGAAGPVPIVAQAGRGLAGEAPSPSRVAEVAASAAEETDPIDDVRGPAWYKRRVMKTLVERALLCALQRATA